MLKLFLGISKGKAVWHMGLFKGMLVVLLCLYPLMGMLCTDRSDCTWTRALYSILQLI
jgi:hypothetical protein